MRQDEKSDESSSEEEGQAFYAGGSERRYVPSQMSVLLNATLNLQKSLKHWSHSDSQTTTFHSYQNSHGFFLAILDLSDWLN